MGEPLVLNYNHDIEYESTALNVVGATTNLTLRTITAHTDANSIYVRKFGTDYLITDVTDIEDPVDVNMTFKVYALDGTLLGSRVGGGAFVDGAAVSEQGCYLEIEASGGDVTVLAGIDIDTDVDAGGMTFVCAAETITDGDTLRLYLAYSGSTYYDSAYKYGGGRHTPDSSTRLPYFDITTAIADPDVTGFTICTVLDSATYDEQFSISIPSMILQAAIGQTPTITSSIGATITNEVTVQYTNINAIYFNKTGLDANAGTWQEPKLTVAGAIAARVAHSIVYGGSGATATASFEEEVAIAAAYTLESDYGYTPSVYKITDSNGGSSVYGFILDGIDTQTTGFNWLATFTGNFKHNTIKNVTTQGILCDTINFTGTISHNLIYGMVYGIRLIHPDNGADVTGTLEYNIIHDCPGGNGIHIDRLANGDNFDMTISNNLIYNCSTGIVMTEDGVPAGTWEGTVENNTIANNTNYGIYISHGSDVNTIFRDMIVYDNGTDLYVLDTGGTDPTITESNYGTSGGNAWIIGAGNITTDPEFCKDTSPYKWGISSDSGAYRTDTSTDDMGTHYRIIEINESDIEINGFNIDGQDQYNNAIYILDSADHTGLTLEWNSVFDFQGIAIDLYDDDTALDATIINSIIRNNGDGIKFTYGGNTVTECLIYSNANFGVHANYTSHILNHCIFYNNKYGIYFESSSAGQSIKNSIFHLNSLYGIYSEVIMSLTYSCITDAVFQVTYTNETNTEDNPLFVDMTDGAEDFNIKTVEGGYLYDSSCLDGADDDYDIGTYKVTRAIDEDSWAKYELEFNPQLSWSNEAKGYVQFESAAGNRDNYAKAHKRRFTCDMGRRKQVSSEELRQKMEYFQTLIKTRENEIVDERTKFRLHLQPTTYLDSNTLATVASTTRTLIDGAKSWIENQWKGFWVGIIWEHGTNMVYDATTKTGSIMGAWTDDEWIGYYTHHNNYYYYIKDSGLFQLTFSDPNDTMTTTTADWNIEKYFRIESNTNNMLVLEDPNSELPDGAYDYYINFIEVRAFVKTFNYRQPQFDYTREHSKTGYKLIFEET